MLDAQGRLAGRDFAGRVEELSRILDEAGYLADFERRDDGSFRITEHNCAILAVARRHGHACTTELSFLREVLPGATVERVSHIVSGGHACVYVIVPPPPRRGRRLDPSTDLDVPRCELLAQPQQREVLRLRLEHHVELQAGGGVAQRTARTRSGRSCPRGRAAGEQRADAAPLRSSTAVRGDE